MDNLNFDYSAFYLFFYSFGIFIFIFIVNQAYKKRKHRRLFYQQLDFNNDLRKEMSQIYKEIAQYFNKAENLFGLYEDCLKDINENNLNSNKLKEEIEDIFKLYTGNVVVLEAFNQQRDDFILKINSKKALYNKEIFRQIFSEYINIYRNLLKVGEEQYSLLQNRVSLLRNIIENFKLMDRSLNEAVFLEVQKPESNLEIKLSIMKNLEMARDVHKEFLQANDRKLQQIT